ncbi:threonine synthase [Tumebacillus sp. BK434]|uniref:threonine synthase n=1 Tax=Tumebacillus sp. BK434 TaxID=2512169 RepID=UPI001049C6F9|nr:threonine synthase [Tumebacillus sp. BK434]TCP54573.1 threonine synthase [Tumebacillus sp. BK434]
MTTNSLMTHLECSKCGTVHDADKLQQLCRECAAPLLVRYDLQAAAKMLKKEDLLTRPASLWRYKELLPVRDERNIVSFGEGMTPIYTAPRAGTKAGVPNLYIKDEGILPTATFKARGAAVGVSKAKEVGVKTLAMPTNGNAGGAWALYAARAGIQSYIVMPENAPKITRNETAVSGADLYLVNGVISDAGKIVGKAVGENGWFDASTLKEPYRIEGKKTMGYEIAEQFNWEVPDVILYPTGGGVGLIAIYKALQELQAMGWIGEKMPRLVSVQASGCAPIVKAWQEGKRESEFWPDSDTIAFGVNVPKALGDFLVLEAVYNTDGCAIAIDDEDTLRAQQTLASLDGAFICPEGASLYAAVEQLKAQDWLNENDKVLLLNTGAGLKYPNTVQINPPLLQPGDDLPNG